MCHECGGDGAILFDNEYNDYTVDCKTCGSTGNLKRIILWTSVFGVKLNPDYLAKIDTLPGIMIAVREDGKSIAFKFDGGHGVLMGLVFDD